MRRVVLPLIFLCCSVHGFSEQLPEVTFTLKATRTPAVYHLGEQIVCRLSFSAALPGKYWISEYGKDNTGKEDRLIAAGAMQEVFFAPQGTDATDPHVDLGRQLGFITVGSILHGYWELSLTPVAIKEDLNQWLRLAKPGNYQIQAQSSRVSLGRLINRHVSLEKGITVNSNSIQITILADDENWAWGQLQKAISILDSPTANEQEKTEAARRLRYLNTDAAVSPMVRELPTSLGEPWHSDLYQGLLESSWRREAIAAVEETLRNPQRTVSHDAVELLATLVLVSEYAGKPLPQVSPDHLAQIQTLREEAQHRRDQHMALMAKYTAELSASVPKRTGMARADAIFTLWQNAELRQGPKKPIPPMLYSLRQEIASVADELTPEQQTWLISIYWNRLPKEKLIPFVKRIATASAPIYLAGTRQDLRQQARSRLCELQPTICQHS